MDVRIETIDAFDIITSFAIGPYPTSAPQAWDQFFAWLGKQNEIQPKQLIGFGLDDPFCTPEHLIRYVAGATFEGSAKSSPEEKIHLMQIKGGTYGIYTMKGPYHNMPQAFAKLKNEWLPSTDHQVDFSRPLLEVYLNDPSKVSEDEYLTDLHLPLLS